MSALGYGKERRSTACTTLKIAVFAPMPSARVTMTTAVNPGTRQRARAAEISSSVTFRRRSRTSFTHGLTESKWTFSVAAKHPFSKGDLLRKVLYGGAMSLDGFIAGPNGEYDWIVMDPDIDFAEMTGQFDTFLIGRKTFEAMRRMGSDVTSMPATQNIVFSRTLKPSEYPHVTISADAERVVADLRTKPGKDIALFGGGELFRSLLAAGLVDGVGVSLIPVLLGGGIPLLPSPAGRATLKLRKHRIYEKTGTVGLWYDIERS